MSYNVFEFCLEFADLLAKVWFFHVTFWIITSGKWSLPDFMIRQVFTFRITISGKWSLSSSCYPESEPEIFSSCHFLAIAIRKVFTFQIFKSRKWTYNFFSKWVYTVVTRSVSFVTQIMKKCSNLIFHLPDSNIRKVITIQILLSRKSSLSG